MVGLVATALGAAFMFAPEVLLEKTQLTVGGNFGFSTIRGLIGGPALVAGGMAGGYLPEKVRGTTYERYHIYVVGSW